MTRSGDYNNQIKPSIPYVELHGANTASSVFDSPDWNILKWQVVKIITPDFIDENATDYEGIRVLTTGLYRIDLELCFDCAQCSGVVQVATRVSKGTGLYLDRIEINNSRSCGTIDEGIIQLNSSITVYLIKGEMVFFEFRTTDENIQLMAEIDDDDVYHNFSRARISFIPMGGWNNNNAGNVINRGVRR
jgi:hypothetical protein